MKELHPFGILALLVLSAGCLGKVLGVFTKSCSYDSDCPAQSYCDDTSGVCLEKKPENASCGARGGAECITELCLFGRCAVPKPQCQSTNTAGCRRGVYVSPYTDHVGDIQFEGQNEQFAWILKNNTKQKAVIDFLVANKFDTIALYNLEVILADPVLSGLLADFMRSAREAGVLRIDAIGALDRTQWDKIVEFHNDVAPFDGFVTEIEYWNEGGSFDDFIGVLVYINSIRANNVKPSSSGTPMTVSVYTGRFDVSTPEAEAVARARIDKVVALVDYLYLENYVKAPDTIIDSHVKTVQMVFNANQRLGRDVAVWPLLSAEGEDWYADPSEWFMGDWLHAHSLTEGESSFLSTWESKNPDGGSTFAGFFYYSYFFLKLYLVEQ